MNNPYFQNNGSYGYPQQYSQQPMYYNNYNTNGYNNGYYDYNQYYNQNQQQFQQPMMGNMGYGYQQPQQNYQQNVQPVQPNKNIQYHMAEDNPNNPSPFEDYVPGRLRPVQLEDANGNSIDIDKVFVPGGTTETGGGYNPVTGRITENVKTQGFPQKNFGNPGYDPFTIANQMGVQPQQQYQQFYQNQPQYYTNQQQQMGPVPAMEYGNPANPIIPTACLKYPDGTVQWGNPRLGIEQFYQNQNNVDPRQAAFGHNFGQKNNVPNQMTMYSSTNQMYNPMYRPVIGRPINEFDAYVNDMLYTTAHLYDIHEELAELILTDEEREMAGKNRNKIVGYDYFNQPIYGSTNSVYGNNKTIQEQFEEARSNYVNHYVNISRMVHSYLGDSDEVDYDKIRERWDPWSEKKINQPKSKMAKIMSKRLVDMTEEEKREYNREMAVYETFRIHEAFELQEQIDYQIAMAKQMAWAAIKRSHYEILGLEPGYGLPDYLDNAYKINIANAMEKQKELDRKNKPSKRYDINNYRYNLAKVSGKPIPIESIDNDFVSVEDMLKNKYEKLQDGEEVDCFWLYDDGACVKETKNSLSHDDEKRIKFLNALVDQKDKDRVRRMMKG